MFATLAAAAQIVSVKSPDGRNEIRIDTEPTLTYAVFRDGKARVAPSPISLELEGMPALGAKGAKVHECTNRDRRGKVPTPLYKKSQVDERANETRVTFEGGWAVSLIARDDGVAYRFETNFETNRIKVLAESAPIAFPSESVTLKAGIARTRNQTYYGRKLDRLCNSWEAVYTNTTVSALGPMETEIAYLPLLSKYDDGGWMCVTESDLRDYPGWNLGRAAGSTNALSGVFAQYPDHARDESDGRHVWIGGRLGYLAETAGARTYPWRVFLLADNPVKFCEADAVYVLAAPCALEGDLSWIKPGKVAWEWWNAWNVSGPDVKFKAGCNTDTYKYYVDFAARNGVEYVIMDEGWSVELKIMEVNPETDVPAICKYAKKRGVGIILWCSWPQLIGRQHEVFGKYAKMGASGFKIDFMDRDDQFLEQFLEETAKIAAEYKLVIDYHGMHKPTGMSRTYPNILNYEGVHGLEQMKWTKNLEFPQNDLNCFFARMTAGPMDYTPGAMINYTRDQFRAINTKPGSQGTRVHQMALMSMYEAPLQMLCDSPTQYERNLECFKFMAAVPTTWDETRGLAGDPDGYAVCARRKGETWYVSAIGSWEPRNLMIDVAFLGDQILRAEIFEDGPNADRDATDYTHRFQNVSAKKPLEIHLAPGGGFTARITPASWFDRTFLR